MDERLWGIVVDSFGKLLIPGLTVTIPLTLISFAIGLVLAIVVALVRVAKVPVAQRIVATTYEPLVLYCEVGLIYLAFCTVLTWLQGVCEKRLAEHF